MFGTKKTTVVAPSAESLNKGIDGIVTVFTTALTSLTSVVDKASAQVAVEEEAIKKHEAEKAALQTTIERANSIREKISGLLA